MYIYMYTHTGFQGGVDTEREGLIGGEPAVNAPNTILENLVEFT
jgi:hypothetical protein